MNLTIQEAAKRAGVSNATLRRWVSEGKVKGAFPSGVKTGSGEAWLIPEDALASLPTPQPAGKRSPHYGSDVPHKRVRRKKLPIDTISE